MNRVLSSLCVLLALVQATLVDRAVVLCVEPGGVVNVESTAASECCPGQGDAPAERAPCECVDVALSGPALPSRDDGVALDGSAAGTLATGVVAVIDFAPALPAHALREAVARATPRSCRLVGTTILRV